MLFQPLMFHTKKLGLLHINYVFFFFFFCNGGILGIWPHNAITYENLYSLIDNIHYAITYENHDNSYLFKHNSCFWVFVFCFFFNDGKALAYLMFNLC